LSDASATVAPMPSSPPTRPWTAAEARAAGLIELSRRPPFLTYLRQLWARREFAMLVPLGDMRQKNMDTVLGSFWHLLNPLFQAAIYYLLFGVILAQRGGVDNYPAWLIIGLFTFSFTQKSIQSSSRIIVAKVAMLRSLNFPAGILPVSVNLSELLAFGPAIVVMFAVVAASGVRPTVMWLVFLPLAAVQLVFNLGLSLVVARLTVHFRDVDHLLNHVLRMWFYFSGVLFPISVAPEGWMRTLLSINPPHAFIAVARGLLLDGRVETFSLMLALGWTALSLALGTAYFYRHEGRYSNAA
jgi:teichoic acid transport system permease protein